MDATKANRQVNRPPARAVSPERLKRVADATKVPRVRVETLRDDFKGLKFPGRPSFRASGSVEWPYDRFTQKRIRDGDIKVVPAESEPAELEPQPLPPQAKKVS
jgi:hypothetical protein